MKRKQTAQFSTIKAVDFPCHDDDGDDDDWLGNESVLKATRAQLELELNPAGSTALRPIYYHYYYYITLDRYVSGLALLTFFRAMNAKCK